MFFLLFVGPLAGKLLLTLGMGMGGDHLGQLWIHFHIMLTQFGVNCKTILGPPMQTNYVFQSTKKSLKWHILTSSPLFDKNHPSP